ncbi:MAG: N-acetylmuramoyl-L-alanine amidase [Pedobacter sp.]|nr:MAG: N-acetylmuramoyl-L-alanine amidase [Pedobacter sp.]
MILIYLLKVSACTVVFFAAYQFLLSKLTFFKLNRLYLLSALFFSFLIPALTVESRKEVVIPKKELISKVAYGKGTITEKDFESASALKKQPVDWNQVATFLYCFIMAGLIIRTLWMIGSISYSIRKNISSQVGTLVYVQADSAIKNCTFLNKIIVDESLEAHEKQLVITHESAHLAQAHAIDKLLINFIACILWFNPIIYFWRNALEHNHEFLADEAVLKSADKHTYAALLLNLATPATNFTTNSFSKLPLKNRIMMLYKKPNNKVQKLLYFSVIPMVLLCSVAFINRKEVIVQRNVAKDNQSLSTYNLYQDKSYKTSIVLDPNAKPAFNEAEVVLVLDAGHGGKDAASVALDGQLEKDMNLRAVKILQEEAKKRGIKVRLTRSTDEFIALRDRLPLQLATAFISIHHNATPKGAPVVFGGIEVYVSKLNSNIKIAEELGAGILSKLKQADGITVQDSLKNASLLLLRESKTPAVLIELGNITDQKSLDFIKQEANLRKISNLILDGFVVFSKRGC